jgi:tetratricopeptide (TPR) repeat protein
MSGTRFTLAALVCAACAAPVSAPDFDALWDHGDPAGTEAAFRVLLAEHSGAARAWRLELETQVARALGLQQRFEEALALLDGLQLADAGARVAVRAQLERGRVLRSRGDAPAAVPHFQDAWEGARAAGEDALAVDAAHMLALVAPTPDEAHAWNDRALQLAGASADPAARRWRGALFNNVGWTHHDAGCFEAALASFRASAAAFAEDRRDDRQRVARWAAARALRSLGRHAEALAAQAELARELDRAGAPDGFVFEELAENLVALGRADEAPAHYRRAYELLREDTWLRRDGPARLERLRRLGAVE